MVKKLNKDQIVTDESGSRGKVLELKWKDATGAIYRIQMIDGPFKGQVLEYNSEAVK